jgi:hypothetical protein
MCENQCNENENIEMKKVINVEENIERKKRNEEISSKGMAKINEMAKHQKKSYENRRRRM